MSKPLDTYQQFLAAAKIERLASLEAFDEDARKPLDDKLRLGNAAGPLVCLSSTKKEAQFEAHLTLPFDWGKLKVESQVHPVRVGEIVQVRSNHPKGKLTPTHAPISLAKSYYKDPDLSLTPHATYLFEETYFDGIDDVIFALENSPATTTWPSGLPAKPFLPASADASAEARALAACLDERNPVFAVKGPPGTGKTDLLADVALGLAKKGKKVGIITVSHDAVNNALARAAQKLPARHAPHTLQKHGGTDPGAVGIVLKQLGGEDQPDIWGTVLASATKMIEKRGIASLCFKHGTCDVLLLDEAGQIPAHEAAALRHIAKRMILFGDEDQLPNITKGSHPPGSHGDSSAMRYIRDVLDPAWTIALETTHRMNSDICGLIKKHFYPDINLKAGKNANAQLLENGSPFPALIKDDFPHPAPRLSRSEKEASRVLEWVNKLLKLQCLIPSEHENGNPAARPMTTNDIAILTPFRAHAAAITKAINAAGIADANKLHIGTVDKMQGLGVAAVIYSLASSSKDYIANQAEWLFSSNRWNVAISRAQACAIVVGDLNAHFNAVPNALHGIAAQQKIRELMEDEAWKTME